MTRTNRALILLLAVIALPACRPAMPAMPRLAFEKYKPPNGLEVILVEDKRLPLVTVNTWYHVSPIQEKAGRTGFAHTCSSTHDVQDRRMCRADGYIQRIEQAGELNGTHDFDRTNYFQTVPSNQLEMVM